MNLALILRKYSGIGLLCHEFPPKVSMSSQGCYVFGKHVDLQVLFSKFLQICHEFERFSTYLPEIKVAVFYGGVNIKVHKELLKNECPHIVVGTPGRILALARDKDLGLKNVRHFILDECDKMLESLGTSFLSLSL